jgi:hypothetical protein
MAWVNSHFDKNRNGEIPNLTAVMWPGTDRNAFIPTPFSRTMKRLDLLVCSQFSVPPTKANGARRPSEAGGGDYGLESEELSPHGENYE